MKGQRIRFRGRFEWNDAWNYNHECVAAGHIGTTFEDGIVPDVGEVWYYLVESMNSCGASGFATSTAGPRPALDACEYESPDQDGDGVIDLDDNCPLTANPPAVRLPKWACRLPMA